MSPTAGTKALIETAGLDTLLSLLAAKGYRVIGPTLGEGAIIYDEISGLGDLPAGWGDEQEGGRYRLHRRDDGALFGYTQAPQSWKRWLYPPEQRLWAADRAGGGFRVLKGEQPVRPDAFIGVRACELAAMQVQDKVFDNGDFKEPGYLDRRRDALVVAVACARSGGTCFCASMGTGPAPGAGFDLLLTELIDGGRHVFVIEAGSERGAALLAELPHAPATEADQRAAAAVPKAAEAQQKKRMDPDAPGLLARNREHARWDDVARRCMACANCTMVCPTCFCSTVEDVTDLAGNRAERVRRWDSCFSLDFSYVHGGSVRTEGYSRYRQWITHKLSSWHDQFGTSGCVGCGRCITWCPVGIDITEEVKAIRDSEQGR